MKKNEPPAVSRRRFAEIVGLSDRGVGDLADRGVIPSLRDKRIPILEALRALVQHGGKASARAEQLLADPGQIPELRSSVQGPQPCPVAPEPLVSPSKPPAPAPAAAEPEAESPHARLSTELREAELRKKRLDAQRRELDVRARSGELVEVAVVRADAAKIYGEVRSRLLSIAPRVAPLVAVVPQGPRQTAEIERLIADEIYRALQAVNEGQFAQATTEAAQ